MSHIVAIMTAQKNGTFEALYRCSTPYQPFNDKIDVSMRQVFRKMPHDPHKISQARIVLTGATSSLVSQLKKWI
ncbi:hypothetical protein ABPS01_10005 [Streptococcus sp. ZJ151]